MEYKMLLYVRWICVLLLFSTELLSEEKGEDYIGKLIDSYGLEVHSEPGLHKKFTAISTPALVIGRTNDGGYRLLMPDSTVAWSKTVSSAKAVNIFSKRDILDATTVAFSDGDDLNLKWKKIRSKGGAEFIKASNNLYEQTPDYVRQKGRMLYLPLKLNYYKLPQFNLRFPDDSGWVFVRDIQFQSAGTSDRLKLTGLIKDPFLALASAYDVGERPASSLTFMNLALYKTEKLNIKNVQWRLEAVVIPEKGKKQQLKSIAFYSSNKNSYLYVINWNEHKSQYIGYSGILSDGDMYSIGIPVILTYKVRDINNDGRNEVLLYVMNIGGDNNTEEWIEFNGKCQVDKVNYSISDKLPDVWK